MLYEDLNKFKNNLKDIFALLGGYAAQIGI
jgi:hypothetical protein